MSDTTSAEQAADKAAEGLRQLAHLLPDLDPSDLYPVLGELSQAAGRLGPILEGLARVHDHNAQRANDPATAATVADHLSRAAGATTVASNYLEHGFQGHGKITWDSGRPPAQPDPQQRVRNLGGFATPSTPLSRPNRPSGPDLG